MTRRIPRRSYYKNKLILTWKKGDTAILCSAYRKSGENVNFCDIHVFVVRSGTTCEWRQWAGRVDRGRVKQLQEMGLIHAVIGTSNLWRKFTMDPIELASLINNTKKWIGI